ncbi:unnamed protein product [Brassica oleracea]
MGRAPCCEKVGIKRGRWTAEEDHILSSYIQSNGEGSWRSLPKNAAQGSCSKYEGLGGLDHLQNEGGKLSSQNEPHKVMQNLYSLIGGLWSLIAGHLPGRTDNEIKNYWNSHLRRKLHNFIIRKPSISHDAPAVIMNVPPASPRPPSKRRPGRTSRSAMKPKTRKTKRTSAPPEPEADVAVKEVAGEEAIMMELSGAEAELGPCDYYGAYHEGGDCCNNNNNLMGTNGDNLVLSFDDNIMDLLLDEADACNVLTSCGGDAELSHLGDSEVARGLSETSINQGNLDCLQPCPSVQSLINYELPATDASMDECIDWHEGNRNSLCGEKEGSDSIVSWLLDGDDDATVGKTNCENFGEPLDHDEENALVAWLVS